MCLFCHFMGCLDREECLLLRSIVAGSVFASLWAHALGAFGGITLSVLHR